jgi:hypothetical protein
MAIYDVTGKVVYKVAETTIPAGQQEIKINTSNLPSGTYSVVVKTAQGDLKEKLMVKH